MFFFMMAHGAFCCLPSLTSCLCGPLWPPAPGGRVARRAPLLSLPPTKGLPRGPQKLDKVLRQQTAPVSTVPTTPTTPTISTISTTQITPDPANSRIPIHKQRLSQVSQLSQLPRRPLIPQPTRIPAHKQHLSQASQLPPQRRPQPPPPHPVNWLGHGKAIPTISRRTHRHRFPFCFVPR